MSSSEDTHEVHHAPTHTTNLRRQKSTLRKTVSDLDLRLSKQPHNLKLSINHAKTIKEFQLHDVPLLSKDSFSLHFHDRSILSKTGKQATIYKVKWIGDGFQKYFALKHFVVDLGHRDSVRDLKFALNEFKVMSHIKSNHLARMHKLYYSYDDTSRTIHVFIVMDLYRDFFDFIVQFQPSIWQIYNWFGQLVSALFTLHTHKIVHRDIKIDNLLLDPSDDDKIYLADFGMLCDLKTTKASECQASGSMEYVAPDVLIHSRSNFATDICGLGITFWVMYHGTPFYDPRILAYMYSNIRSNSDFMRRYTKLWQERFFHPQSKPHDDPWNLWAVLSKMCHPDPLQRPSAEELVEWVKYKQHKQLS